VKILINSGFCIIIMYNFRPVVKNNIKDMKNH